MRVLICGAGKTGTYLAQKLHGEHELTIVEQRPERVAIVQRQFPGITCVRGDACEPAVLERAGIAQTDLVAALTGDDEDNLVISLLSKQTFAVPLVFARTNHPSNEWLFNKRWGVDVAVSTAAVIESLVEKEVSLGDIITLLRFQADDLVIDELKLPADAASIGKTIAQLGLPECTQIIAVINEGQVKVPSGATVLEAGDELLILAKCDSEAELQRTFGVRAESR